METSQEAAGVDPRPETAPSATEALEGPQIEGSVARLLTADQANSIYFAINFRDHEWTDEATAAVEAIVRAHVDAALAEVERRIEAEKWQFRRTTGASAGNLVCRAYESASQIVSNYRQEQR